MIDVLSWLRPYVPLDLGKGGPAEILRSAVRSLSVVRAVPGRAEPPRVWHYTSTQGALDIEADCVLLPGRWGTDGPGVYVTDIVPTPDRAGISNAIWDRWRGPSMEAYIGLPFIDAEMQPSKKHAHVWFVKESELRITGLEDLVIGFWAGADPSDPADVGSWAERPLRDCT